jgi:cellulose synthase/poly-beta-1,6-N-acetylglucosamine synthase-like glycosyltransferase
VSAETILLAAYLATMSVLAVYGLHRIALLARFHWEGREPAVPSSCSRRVTVQLPVFNERTVAARLIRAAGGLRYPRELLQIQVLDDSTDETVAIVEHEVGRLRSRGLDAVVVRRERRAGFKAGALDHGTRSAKGELLCIFDADFVPPPEFLERLVGRFEDPTVGMVQARWGHQNRDENLLTRASSTLLDGHFVIEHTVRHDRRLFFNFNGTAGIWRRAAIESAGGWQHDTLTEDLDLSYRAQLAGWRFVYEPCVVAPAEVPADIAAFKSQQHRWAKGSVQVLRKLCRSIVCSKEPLGVKLEALAHLTGNAGYPCVLALAILLPLSVGLAASYSTWLHAALCLLCTLSVLLFYERSQRVVGRPLGRRLCDILAAMALGIGMSVSQTQAVLAGLSRRTGAFLRTPKHGGRSTAHPYRAALRGPPGVELLLAAWFAWGMGVAVLDHVWGALPFLLLFFSGFAWVGALSLGSWRQGQRAHPARLARA